MRVSTVSSKPESTATSREPLKLQFNATPYKQDYDDYDNYDDEDYSADTAWGAYNSESSHAKVAGTSQAQKSSSKIANEGAMEKKTLQSVNAKVNLSKIDNSTYSNSSHAAKNLIDRSENKANQARNIGLCRDTRATVDQVLDPRTAQVLGKFFHHKIIDNLQGCISTGKEANVYFATSGRSEEDLLEFVNWKVGTESIPSAAEIGSHLKASIFDTLEEAKIMQKEEDEENEKNEKDNDDEHDDNEENIEEEEEDAAVESFGMQLLNEKGNNKSIFKEKTANSTNTNTDDKKDSAVSQFKTAPKQAKTNLCLAVKIFNTSVLIFKDREKYVNGDIRFAGKRGQMKSSNARRMVPIWCEKEFRNLARIRQRAKFVKVPTPIKSQQNILVMTLIGDHESGKAAPRIKDVVFENEGYSEDEASLLWDLLYLQCCRIVRDLYQNCGLVHGDLSEYNMLFYENEIYVIDVSQAVEMDHPEANDFLKRDCGNLNRFFANKGVSMVPHSQFYDYVTKESELRDIEEIRNLYEEMSDDQKQQIEMRDLQFVNTWVPSNLHQINELHLLDKEVDKYGENEESIVCSNLLAPSLKEKKDMAKKQLESILEDGDSPLMKKKKNKKNAKSSEQKIDAEAANAESAESATAAEEPQDEKKEGDEEDSENEDNSDDEDSENSDESSDDEDSDSGEDGEGFEGEKKKKHKIGERDPNMSKAEWKRKIKEEKSDKRANTGKEGGKIPKKDKRKAKKKAHAGRK